RKQNELDKRSMADELCSCSSFWIMPKKTQKTVRYFRILHGVSPLVLKPETWHLNPAPPPAGASLLTTLVSPLSRQG
ncbi:MAG: hypothetical protein WC228_07965, partial [Candidatus Cloacimonadaceae bacterium]